MVPVVSIVTCTMIGVSVPAALAGAARPHDSGLRLQQVLTGFNHDRIHTAVDESAGALLVVVPQQGIRGVAESG